MAEALWYAAADLLSRGEERRIAVVLTDGEPGNRAEALRLLGLCAGAGIETVGIGIQQDVARLFPVATRVDDVSGLRDALFGVAERLLIAA